ncbi:Mitochondrial import inner membrane translocase subunit tim22 [Naganishia adeliensis]|uniref:Mitochondrial import inner membrane translocase subunit tim22 n=1 Tax=Naganishia adeliensis TaxID=92952 RepID=A0ACC2W414_9TREE|nr:Mitochondrial import inner membrane translocase subunit tim22 [Naganishia adeliensis]
MSQMPLLAPIYLPGQEPVAPGTTPEERQEMQQMVKYGKYASYAMESCPVKVVMSGGAGKLITASILPPGFGLGAFFSLMSATFAYEDPLSKASEKLVGTRAQTAFIFKEMGRNMWTSGKGFAKVGALYSGFECCIEGYRAKNDIYNAVAGGFLSGAVLARSSGIRAALGGGAAFAAFSAVIDLWIRKEPAE